MKEYLKWLYRGFIMVALFCLGLILLALPIYISEIMDSKWWFLLEIPALSIIMGTALYLYERES